jgi:mRNA-degrading endonuclease toxin of MazEF toxin-antitoxin module
MPPSAPRRGEIWSAYTPGQPDDPHQPRFVLIVSADVRNRVSDDYIVVPIFSSGRLGPTHVPLAIERTGLRHDSVLFCEEITTVHADFLEGGPHGRVSADVLSAVVVGVRRALGDFSS